MVDTNPPPISATECVAGVTGAPYALETWAARGFSQFGADGILHKLFTDIGTTNKYFVEFGTQDGTQCNTRRLREACGWSGLLMDGGHDNAAINLHREFITQGNILSLLAKYGVPKTFDLLSVDIDGNDFHVLKRILTVHVPRVIVVETNFQVLRSVTIKYHPKHRWDGTCYGSASVAAFEKMLGPLGYSRVASYLPDTYWVHSRTVPHPQYIVRNISTNRCHLSHAWEVV